ncbi:MAG: hypothetical protein ACK6DP_05685 [Gemmatimonas sp.]|jgi:hypothetical protein|uniref:hypothetical protein n=1 Tax=Gemmatimonas sp. TaxID=1962908 RepID=UPI00391FAB6D|nr:hypothetical protein [Gemmatimonadota bacterium]
MSQRHPVAPLQRETSSSTAAPEAATAAADRSAVAREALALCAGADALAREAESVIASRTNEDRLLAVLERRDELVQDLAEQLALLRFERPRADSPLLADTERLVAAADAVVDEVCAAVSATQRRTLDLAARMARRTEEIRAELDEVQRAVTASVGYGIGSAPHFVDRVR